MSFQYAGNLAADYLVGNMPLADSLKLTALWVGTALFLLGLVRYFRKRKKIDISKAACILANGDKVISQEITGSEKSVLVDTPFIAPSFPLAGGFFVTYAWARLRDAFMRFWYYDTITVIRIKNEGKADHRAYVVKTIQQMTINWDNCTYDVEFDSLIPIRKNYFMLVNEGCTKPINPWLWTEAMALVESKLNIENYDKWSDEDKKKFGKFSFSPKIHYTKMNNRNAELLGMTSIPNMQVMYYGVIVAAFCAVVILLMMSGYINSAMSGGFETMRSGIVEVLKQIAELKKGG